MRTSLLDVGMKKETDNESGRAAADLEGWFLVLEIRFSPARSGDLAAIL
jgi:hypothetical protein